MQNAKLQSDLAKREAAIENHRKDLAVRGRQIVGLDAEITLARAEVQKIVGELEQQQARVSVLEQELAARKLDLEQFQDEAACRAKDISDMQSHLETVHGQLSEAQKEASRLSAEVSSRDGIIAKFEADARDHHAVTASLREAVASLETHCKDYARQSDENKRQLQELLANIETEKARLAEVRASLLLAHTEIARQRDLISERDRRIGELGVARQVAVAQSTHAYNNLRSVAS